jgi:antitoxin component HigA of HigAB toxin-antitoxin module
LTDALQEGHAIDDPGSLVPSNDQLILVLTGPKVEESIEVAPQEIVRTLLEDNGLRQADLVGPVFPSRSAVSDFLAGRRPLSYERAGKLAAFFHMSPAVFYPA